VHAHLGEHAVTGSGHKQAGGCDVGTVDPLREYLAQRHRHACLAAIGYHFGSKDALMNQAVFDSVGDWGEDLQDALIAAGPVEPEQPLAHFEAVMRQTFKSFAGPGSGLWHAQLELLSLAQRNDDLRAFIAGIQEIAGTGLAELFLGIDPAAEPEAARLAGIVMHAMFIGLIAKYFLDPERAPSAGDMADGLRVISERGTNKAR
jgi:AcrR family transcriptional regulator